MRSLTTFGSTLVAIVGAVWSGAMNRRTFLATSTAFAASLSAISPASAQSNSSRPIRLIVPVPAGGAIEPYARLIAEHMARSLDRIIIVENKPGGTGNVGAQFVVNSPADGSFLLLGNQALTEINPSATDPKWTLDDF